MKLRTLALTIVVLAVLSGIVALIRDRRAPTSADARVGRNLVDRSVVEKAAKLQISDQGKSVTLVRQGDGSWRVATYFDLPADFQKLSRFVDDLTQATLQRLVTRSPERIARLEFKDTKIGLLDGSGKELWSVTLGKAAETGGRFVRFGNEPKAYLATLNTWVDADSKSWADTQLLNVKPEDIAKIELTLPSHGAGTPEETVVVSRPKKDAPWTADKTPPNEKLKTDRISSLLGSLAPLRFSDTTDPTDPRVAVARQHLRAFKLTTFDGTTYTVAIGRKPEEKKVKPPTPAAGGKAAPATPGSASPLAKSGPAKPGTPPAPEFETIPAGPAFAFVTSTDANAPINALMKQRAFEVADYVANPLPHTIAELFEPAPPAAPSPAPKK